MLARLVLLWSLIGFTLSASAQTGHPYYPLQPGQSIRYLVMEIAGVWKKDTHEIWILSRTPLPAPNTYETIYFGQRTCPTYFGQGPLFTEHYNAPNNPRPLQEGGAVTAQGIPYIGEAINERGQVMIPFEAKITNSPVAGETIGPVQTITYTRDRACEFPPATATQTTSYWRYMTIGHYVSWGIFSDVWRTGLHECGTVANCASYPGQSVYNYAFKRGVGLIDFWYGVLGAQDANGDFPVTGKEYWSLDHQY